MKKFLLFISLNLLALDTDSLLNYTFDDNLDINNGKNLYIQKHKCNACHGDLGEKSSGTFSPLTTFTASELKSILKSYKNDRSFGGKTKAVMQRYSTKLSNKEIDEIIAYIKGKNNLDLPNFNTAEPRHKTENNLFID